MRKLLTIISALLFCCTSSLMAQNINDAVPQKQTRDTLIYRSYRQVDSLTLGTDIFKALPKNVEVSQSPSLERAFREQVAQNADKLFYGFRIKVYFENSSSARAESEIAENKCRTYFPEYECIRSFSNPYFKVVMGEFRTRIEAEKTLRDVKTIFPEASIVKERFRWPSLHEGKDYEPQENSYFFL